MSSFFPFFLWRFPYQLLAWTWTEFNLYQESFGLCVNLTCAIMASVIWCGSICVNLFKMFCSLISWCIHRLAEEKLRKTQIRHVCFVDFLPACHEARKSCNSVYSKFSTSCSVLKPSFYFTCVMQYTKRNDEPFQLFQFLISYRWYTFESNMWLRMKDKAFVILGKCLCETL